MTFPTTRFSADKTLVFTGAANSRTSRWMAADFDNKVVLVSPSTPALYWQPGLSSDPKWKYTRPVPGLPDDDGFDGVTEFAGHLVLWREDVITWSDLGDFANYIPVSVTAASGRAITATEFAQPSTGSGSVFVFLTDISGSFVDGQFVRILTDEGDPSNIRYSYFTVSAVSSASAETESIAASQSIDNGQTSKVYTTSYVAFKAGSRVNVNGEQVSLDVVSTSRNASVVYQLAASSSVTGSVGETVTFPLDQFPFELKVGDVISVGTKNAPGQDLYTITVVGLTLIARRLGIGENQQAVGLAYVFGGSNPTVYVRIQHYVEVSNESGDSISIPSSVAVSASNGLKLTALGYTGAVPAGDVIPAGATIETLDANEAGQLQNVGNGINGPVFGIVKLSSLAYILKRSSVQSMQYVGRDNGVFYIRGGIFDEGPIGRYAWCRKDESAIIFWGSKGWFEYTGGNTAKQIGKSLWDVSHKELDLGRADEIIAFHSKPTSEVWFIYPVIGTNQTKVAVYNYDFESVVIDTYSPDLGGITAAGLLDWEAAPAWDDLDPLELGTSSPGKRWYQYVDEGERPRTVLGIGGDAGNAEYGEDPDAQIPRLLLHGRVPYRASRDDCHPDPVLAVAETPDMDFGDTLRVKYVDTIFLNLWVPTKIAHPAKLKVSLGTRMALDDDIVWSKEASVDVSGNGNILRSLHIRGSGRLVRVRFWSDDPGVKWAISGFRVIARMGNTY